MMAHGILNIMVPLSYQRHGNTWNESTLLSSAVTFENLYRQSIVYHAHNVCPGDHYREDSLHSTSTSCFELIRNKQEYTNIYNHTIRTVNSAGQLAKISPSAPVAA